MPVPAGTEPLMAVLVDGRRPMIGAYELPAAYKGRLRDMLPGGTGEDLCPYHRWTRHAILTERNHRSCSLVHSCPRKSVARSYQCLGSARNGLRAPIRRPRNVWSALTLENLTTLFYHLDTV